MSDDRLQLHIAAWMRQLTLPAVVELRCRDEVVDSVNVPDENAPFDSLAADLLETSTIDAQDEGKSRAYTLVAIDANEERYFCPLRIRRRVDKSAGELLAALARQNAELHQCLVRKDREAADLMLRYAQTLAQDRKSLVDENTAHRQRASEVIDKLESLRSQALERDLVVEKHRSEIETRERLTDAAIPLALAIGHKLTSGAVPSDLPNSMFAEIVKSLSEEQLDRMQAILGVDWPGLSELFSAALEGKSDVAAFRRYVSHLPRETVFSLSQTLNMGQQAALKELLDDAQRN